VLFQGFRRKKECGGKLCLRELLLAEKHGVKFRVQEYGSGRLTARGFGARLLRANAGKILPGDAVNADGFGKAVDLFTEGETFLFPVVGIQ